MIQRIQTLYLLVATIIFQFIFYLPLVQFSDSRNIQHTINIFGQIVSNNGKMLTTTSTNNLSLAGICMLTIILIIITIFLFKKRKIQMRLCIYCTILLFLVTAMIYYFVTTTTQHFNADNFIFKFSSFVPLLCVFFVLMAYRYIRKDELLIRSLNRIR